MPDLKPFNIKFSAIELISKHLTTPQQKIDPSEVLYKTNFSVDVKIATTQKIAIANTLIRIIEVEGENYEGKELGDLAHFNTFCVFEISEFEEVFRISENGSYTVPVDLEILLKSVGISTTRGIMFSELSGTYLQNAILPLIDINKLVRDRVKLEETSKKAATQTKP